MLANMMDLNSLFNYSCDIKFMMYENLYLINKFKVDKCFRIFACKKNTYDM